MQEIENSLQQPSVSLPLNQDSVEEISIHASQAKTDIVSAELVSTDSVQMLECQPPVSSITSKTSTEEMIPSDANAMSEKVAESKIVNDVSMQDMQEFKKTTDIPSPILPIISAEEITSEKVVESLIQSDMQQLSSISKPESANDIQGQDSTVTSEADGSPDNGKSVETAMICQKSASSREKHIEILKEFTEPTISIQEEKLAEGKPLGVQDLTKDGMVENSDLVHPTNLQQVNDEILLIPDITPQENSLQESPQESSCISEVSKDSELKNAPTGKESDEKQEEELSQRIPGRNMMKRQDTLRHETSYDEIPTGSIEKQSDLGVMADKVNEDDELIQTQGDTKEEAKSSEETFRAVFLETFNETKQEMPVVIRSSKNEKRLETIPSMTSETDEFATDDELILDDEDRMLNILDEEQLALLNKVTAATRLSDVTEDDVANVEILELFLSSMQESLEGTVDESLRKVETFMEEHSLSEKITKKLQEAIITAEEALDSASAIPLTLDDVEAQENREDTPIGEQIENTLEKEQIKVKHGYDQDFEFNRVTQLAGIAQLAQVELQKRMNKKQSESDDIVDAIVDDIVSADVNGLITATKIDESSHFVEGESKIKNEFREQETKTPERNMRASSS